MALVKSNLFNTVFSVNTQTLFVYPNRSDLNQTTLSTLAQTQAVVNVKICQDVLLKATFRPIKNQAPI